MSSRKPLIHQLLDTFVLFSERKTVGRMQSEHSIFIPTPLMIDQTKETEDFIKAARYISRKSEWSCSVEVQEQCLAKDIAGVEFIFKFNKNTAFNNIIEYLKARL